MAASSKAPAAEYTAKWRAHATAPRARERAAFLWDGYADVLPGARRVYGRGDRFLVGDAVGYHHPLTAVGMGLGFQDTLCLAHCQSVAEYRARRRPASRVAELLAVGLYEALADGADEAVATRRAIYAMWRRRAAEGTRTMGYLACRDTRADTLRAYQSLGL